MVHNTFLDSYQLEKKKKDLQAFSRIGKTIKKLNSYKEFQILSWTPTYLQHFDNIYISDGVKTALPTHGLGNI